MPNPIHTPLLSMLAVIAVSLTPFGLGAQDIPETEIWFEPVNGAPEATWAELREQGLTLMVSEAPDGATLFEDEGLILMLVRMDGGQPAGAWRSRRVTGVPGGASPWGPEYVPAEAQMGSGTYRLVTAEGSIPSTRMMDGSEEGLAEVLRAVEGVGGDPGSFAVLFPLPMEPAVAARTHVRVLLALPR